MPPLSATDYLQRCISFEKFSVALLFSDLAGDVDDRVLPLLLEVLQASLLVEFDQTRALFLVVVLYHRFVLILLHALLLDQPLADELKHCCVKVLVGEGFPAEPLIYLIELKEDLLVFFVEEPPGNEVLQRLLDLSDLHIDIRYGLLVVIKVRLLLQQVVLSLLPHN